MKHNEALINLRKKLIEKGINELSISEEQESLRENLKKINDLKMKMNEAKIKAIEEAEKPFIEEITKLENDYAFLLKLISD